MLNTIEAVLVKAADFNGDSFDGLPFFAMPCWLLTALESQRIRVEPSDTDYAIWRVPVSDTSYQLAEPGDYVVYFHDTDEFRVVDRDGLVEIISG
jgi:hypothetical protein